MLEKGIDVPRPVALVTQIVGVLPDIASEDGFKTRCQNIMVSLDSEDAQQTAHRIHPHNTPTTPLYSHCHGSKCRFKTFHAPKRMVDCIGQFSFGGAPCCPSNALPVQTVQDVSAQVKGQQTSGIGSLLRGKLTTRHSLQSVDRRVRSGHVSRMVFIVMQQDGLLIQQRF